MNTLQLLEFYQSLTKFCPEKLDHEERNGVTIKFAKGVQQVVYSSAGQPQRGQKFEGAMAPEPKRRARHCRDLRRPGPRPQGRPSRKLRKEHGLRMTSPFSIPFWNMWTRMFQFFGVYRRQSRQHFDHVRCCVFEAGMCIYSAPFGVAGSTRHGCSHGMRLAFFDRCVQIRPFTV